MSPSFTVCNRRLQVTGIALWAVLMVATACAAAGAEISNPHGVAVVIGNRTYAGEGVPKVAYAHRDAKAFRRFVLGVLGFNPSNVIHLRDATQAKMMAIFGSVHSGPGKIERYLDHHVGSDVVVFYSGHGVPGLRDGRGYLLPVDADPDRPELNGYPIDLLYENLGKLEAARSVQVYLDACFSGESPQGKFANSGLSVDVQAALPERLGTKITVLAAASGQEVASWDHNARHGLFSHHLLDALYGAADVDDDKRVTAEEVKDYLDDNMTPAALQDFGRVQHANLTGARTAVLAQAERDEGIPSRPLVHEAAEIFSEALDEVQRIKDGGLRDVALGIIAEARAKAGDIQGALASARSINDKTLRARSLDRIVGVQVIAEDIQGTAWSISEALATARSIEVEGFRSSAVSRIVKLQIATGEFQNALITARAIENTSEREEAIRQIVVAQATAGDVEGALNAARNFNSELNRAGALSSVAGILVSVGDILRAGDIARRFEVEMLRSIIFSRIAMAQADAGDFEGALTTAQNTKRRDSRTLSHIAEAQANDGDVQGAITTARSIKSELSRTVTFISVARVLAAAGDIDGAMSVTQSIESEHSRGEAFSHIAGMLANAGNVQDALRIALRIKAQSHRAAALGRIAIAQAEGDDTRGALATVRNIIEAEGRRDEALTHIVKAQADVGNFRGSLSTVWRIEGEPRRAEALGYIAEARANVGEIQDALSAAWSIEDKYRRVAVLTHIATERAAAGDFPGALDIAGGIQDKRFHAGALKEIAAAWARLGNIQGALDLARGIGFELSRIEALSHIAVADSVPETSAIATSRSVWREGEVQ